MFDDRFGAQPEARDSRRGLPLSATKLPFDMAPLYGNDAPEAGSHSSEEPTFLLLVHLSH